MNAGLGDERTLAHIGRMTVRRAVENIVQRPRGMNQCREFFIRDTNLELVGEFFFQLQRRD